ncbi:MAG: hypothetical protein IBJ03_06305 [Gemmatimonadaceae bacterium]|nr:hypothetical protein [Gemmatimonadaceae bacterium]
MRRLSISVFGRAAAIVAAATSMASSLSAQAAGATANYVYLRGSDTLGVESVTANAMQTVGRLTMRNQPTIEWTHQRQSNDRLGPLRIRVLQTATSATPIQDVSFTIAGDSLRVAITTGKNVSRQAVQVPMPDVVPLVNASVLHSAFVADYGKRRQLDRIPIVLTTGAQTALAELTQQGKTSVLTMGKTVMRIAWAADGLAQTIDIPNQGSRIVRVN